jgi:hypothetical protein
MKRGRRDAPNPGADVANTTSAFLLHQPRERATAKRISPMTCA